MSKPSARLTKSSRLATLNMFDHETLATLAVASVTTAGKLASLDRNAIRALSLPLAQRAQVLVARNFALSRFDKSFVPFETPMGGVSDAETVLALMDYREEALAAAKALGKKTLFNSLVITTIDAALSLYDNMGFYAGNRRIDLHESPAAKMAGDRGVIRLWDMAAKDPMALADSINDESRINTLAVVHGILEIFLNAMVNNYDYGRVLIDDKEPITLEIEKLKSADGEEGNAEAVESARETFRDVGLFLKVRQMDLVLKEHEAYDKNPEWEYEVYDNEVNGPFDGRAARRRCSEELHGHFKRYPNSLRRLASAATVFGNLERNFVTAFHLVFSDFSPELIELMAMPLAVLYKDEAAEIIWEDSSARGAEIVSHWLLEEWKSFCENMLAYVDERVDSAPDGGEAKRLWAEAYARFLERRNGSVSWFEFTEDEARKFVEQADRAAREEWIERRVLRKADGSQIPLETISPDTPQTARQPSKSAIADEIRQGFENLRRDHEKMFPSFKSTSKRKTRKRGKPGRKKSDVREEQVAEGVKWLKAHDGKNPADAARHILDTLKLARPTWKDGGYEGKSAYASLAQAIRRINV